MSSAWYKPLSNEAEERRWTSTGISTSSDSSPILGEKRTLHSLRKHHREDDDDEQDPETSRKHERALTTGTWIAIALGVLAIGFCAVGVAVYMQHKNEAAIAVAESTLSTPLAPASQSTVLPPTATQPLPFVQSSSIPMTSPDAVSSSTSSSASESTGSTSSSTTSSSSSANSTKSSTTSSTSTKSSSKPATATPPPATPPPVATANPTRQQVISIASKYHGLPYKYGGNDPEVGLDCSSLTSICFKQIHVALPRVASDQAKEGTSVPDLDHATMGDLVFFGSPVTHVGIYMAKETMIHAPQTGDVVKVAKVWKKPSKIRRFIK